MTTYYVISSQGVVLDTVDAWSTHDAYEKLKDKADSQNIEFVHESKSYVEEWLVTEEEYKSEFLQWQHELWSALAQEELK